METRGKTKGLNQDVIKYFAALTMFLNHFAHVFLAPGTILYEVFLDIGYFTAITMCYFLVEGFEYTHSRKKYGQRLLIFALISQIPYSLVLGIEQLNMLFTLLLCFFILIIRDEEEWGAWRNVLIILILLFSIFSDWAVMAPIFTLMFVQWKDNKKKMVAAYGIAAVLFGLFNYLSYLSLYSMGKALLHAGFSVLGIAASGIVIIYFYNGQRGQRGRKFSKWFFYIFYPAHIILLGLIRLCM
ncbi:MAG: TraX family protein [Muricomes sp.]